MFHGSHTSLPIASHGLEGGAGCDEPTGLSPPPKSGCRHSLLPRDSEIGARLRCPRAWLQLQSPGRGKHADEREILLIFSSTGPLPCPCAEATTHGFDGITGCQLPVYSGDCPAVNCLRLVLSRRLFCSSIELHQSKSRGILLSEKSGIF